MTDFQARIVDCKVYTKRGLFDHEVVMIKNVQHQILHFKNTDNYIINFIDQLKNNVIKCYPNLSSINIYLNIFDSNNILHRLMITVANMLQDLLKLKDKLASIKKSIFVIVTYEDQIVFVGSISFDGLK